jgi:peptidoglycan/LPS O-acetylase OafA/YrhL
MPNGFIGVDVFFVISGYVITQSLMRSADDSWSARLQLFYTKRIARLFPAFLVIFVFTVIASVLFLSPNVGVQQNAIKSSLGATLGISNFVIPRVTGDYFGASGSSNPFQHTWSLSVEEQFYFLFPLFFLIFLNKKIIKGNFITPVILLSALTILSFSLTLPFDVAEKISNFGTTEYFAPQNRAWEFLAGVITAFLSASSFRIKIAYKNAILTALALSLVFISISTIFTFKSDLYQLAIPVVLASIFLFLSENRSSSDSSPVTPSRFRKSLITLGDWSYSLYLWHWPIWLLTKLFFPENRINAVLIASFFTVFFSALTYRYIESRLNFVINSKIKYWVKFFLLGQVLAVSLFFMTYSGVAKGWGQDWALNSHKIMNRGCDSGLINFDKCSWGNSHSNNKMFIVGDSMSWAIGDAFISAAIKEDMQARSLTRNGCSITISEFDQQSVCGQWRIQVINTLLKEKPKLIVVANSIGYPQEDLQGMGKLLDLFSKASIKTIFVTPPPGGDNYSGLRALAFRPGPKSRESALPARIDLSTYGLSGKQILPGVLIYDPADDLCISKCTIANNGKDYYNYGGHLSVYGNKVLQRSVDLKVEKILQDKLFQ